VYEDPGATCVVDQYPPLTDIDFSMLVVISGDVVDTNEVGTHVITYECRPADFEAAEPQTRTVIVKDGAAPIKAPTKAPTKWPTSMLKEKLKARHESGDHTDACVLAGCFKWEGGKKVSKEGDGQCDVHTPCMTSTACGKWDGGDCDVNCADGNDYACSYDYYNGAWKWNNHDPSA
jgi:hypothetical protein